MLFVSPLSLIVNVWLRCITAAFHMERFFSIHKDAPYKFSHHILAILFSEPLIQSIPKIERNYTSTKTVYYITILCQVICP